ncbi:hypothetical protein E2K98_11145 [Bacillus salipaludis]|uniref:Uncharacterized protein n=1 Tax=Bacillus salipaludis TaxID=2547811 RepID=A0A4R5VRS7_9BACI|nr:hypothetical protein [Bacillus salipaludis]TDK61448.1 hypothetical protein E2K98_11145 [Bacillus salipaludis]
MRLMFHAIFIIVLTLITFFGLGPIMLADGSLAERIITAFIVLILYVIIVFFYRRSLQSIKKRK